MIAWVAAALAGPRQDGERAEAAMDFPAAIAAYETCVAEGGDRDRAYCRTRRDVLAPQAADGFVGWRALAEVRRDYRTIGSDAAIARIEAALAKGGPAEPALRQWLANERARRGEHDELVVLAPTLEPDARKWAEARIGDRVVERRRRWVAAAGAALGGLYAAWAIRGPGELRWRSAGVAAILLGAVPTVMATLWERGLATNFALAGLVVAGGVLLAGRAPVAVAVVGTLGAFAAVAWANGWYPSLGF
ncbi:MAG: hypothetical protein ACOZNI_20505 [Myxococcota bacterium]